MVNMRFSLGNLYRADPTIFDGLELPAGYDKQLFIDTLIDGYGEFAVARLIQDMPRAISTWSRRKAYTLAGLMASTQQEYNPIENYDRIEESTDTGTSSGSGQTSRAGMETESVKLDEETKAGSQSSTTHSARLHGNIGVTTTQQMLAEERKTRLFDVYDSAAKLFAADLLIFVYV